MQSTRQEQVVKSSIELTATKGIQGFTIKNLSKAIGISESGIYRHVENKTEISVSILNNLKEIGEMMSAMVVNDNDTAIERIESLAFDNDVFMARIELRRFFNNHSFSINLNSRRRNWYT